MCVYTHTKKVFDGEAKRENEIKKEMVVTATSTHTHTSTVPWQP